MEKEKRTSLEGIVEEGEFKNGKLFGPGKMTFPGGEVREGEFKGSLLVKGMKKWSKGTVWKGDFKDELLHGTGRKIVVEWNCVQREV